MTTKEAFETVIDAADLFITLMKEKKFNSYNHEALTQAIEIVACSQDLILTQAIWMKRFVARA